MTNFENTFVRGPSPSYSDVISENGGMSTLPIGDKKSLTNNYLIMQKQGNPVIRGRNTFAFWTIVSLLFILTIGNLFLTITIIGVLRLGKGMQSIELVPEEQSVKFFGTTYFDRVYKRDGTIEGFVDQPVTITGDDGHIAINLVHRNGHSHNKLTMNQSGTFFRGFEKFEIKDPVSGETVFTTHKPHYNIPKGAANLYAKSISTSRITSPIGKTLKIQNPDGKISARGSEGLTIDAHTVLLQTDKKVHLSSTMNSSIILNGPEGIYLETEHMPQANSEHGIRTVNMQYKLCVCMPQGKIFRLAVPRLHSGKITCNHYDPSDDPCA